MSSSSPAPAGSGGINLTPKTLVGIAVGVAALILVFSNTGQVTLRFLWMSITAPGWLMLLFVLLAGVAIGLILGRRRYKG